VTGVKDIAGNSLAADVSWSFTTATAAPTFSAGANVTVVEDSAAYNQPWATSITGGPVVFTVGIDHPEFFSADPIISAAGVLTFTPMPDQFGTCNVTVFASNDEGTSSAPASFTITITGVNDAPSFAVGGDVQVAEDSGPYSAVWATNISAGANESAQTLTFTVTNDNPTLFSIAPQFHRPAF